MSRCESLWRCVDAARAGRSNRRLATLLECAPSTLTRWSQGDGPSAEVALCALEFLGVTLPSVPEAPEETIARLERECDAWRQRALAAESGGS